MALRQPIERDEPASLVSRGLVMTIAKTVLGVGLFSVVTASILAEGTTDRQSGASKVALVPSKSEREQFQRMAAQAARGGDIVTGSIGLNNLNNVRLDPCTGDRKR